MKFLEEKARSLRKKINNVKASINGVVISARARQAKIKKISVSFIRSLPRRLRSLFAENIHGTWLLRRWASCAGYLLVGILTFALIIIADGYSFTRQFIHMPNANEAIIGVFTMLLALLIPLAIALIQSDGMNSFARKTMVETIVRYDKAAIVLFLVCVGVFIPSGVHIAGTSLTIKNLYAAILAICAAFIFASFYRSYRWLSDEALYSSGAPDETPRKLLGTQDFSSYRFAWIIRLLSSTKGPQTWISIWSARFPVGYEETIHSVFFSRAYSVLNKKKRSQYLSLSLELDAYNREFSQRNQDGYKFEYVNAEKFFTMHSKIEHILEESYVDSRLDGLWRGKEAARGISLKYMDALMTRHRVWSLFKSMRTYLEASHLVAWSDDRVGKEDEILTDFLGKVFDAINNGAISGHDTSDYFGDRSSPWTVTYSHLYNDKERKNLAFLVQGAYWRWLKSLLDNTKETEYYIKNDTIVEVVFPGADPITMGKLYWLLYLGLNNSDYLMAWIKSLRPIGHMSMGGEFYAATSKEEEFKALRERMNQQEYESVRLMCTLYPSVFRTKILDLENNLERAKGTNRLDLDDIQASRLEDFIRLAGLIIDFYAEVDRKRSKSTKSES